MDARTMRQARAGAVTRLGARRRPLVTKIWRNRDGTEQEYLERDDLGEYLPAGSLAEWSDDQLVVYGQYRGEFSTITCDLLVNARHGGDAGRAAEAILSRARKLDEQGQFCLNMELHQLRMAAPQSLPEAVGYMQRVVRAADDLRLCARPPEPGEPADYLDLAGRY